MAGWLRWKSLESDTLRRVAGCVLEWKRINDFDVKLVAIVTDDCSPFNVLGPSKFLVEYGDWSKVVSIVLELSNGQYKYQVEIFKDGRIAYSPALTSLTALDVAAIIASLLSFC